MLVDSFTYRLLFFLKSVPSHTKMSTAARLVARGVSCSAAETIHATLRLEGHARLADHMKEFWPRIRGTVPELYKPSSVCFAGLDLVRVPPLKIKTCLTAPGLRPKPNRAFNHAVMPARTIPQQEARAQLPLAKTPVVFPCWKA